METSTLSELKLRHTFSITVTSKVATYLRDNYAPVEFFAIVRPTYLERLERWDELREQRMAPLRIPEPTDNRKPQLPQMRRSETDFVVEQTHDVVAWVQVSELGADGGYAPVPVITQGPLDPGSFCLHQGLQRRLGITLKSNSGKQLPWVSVTRVKVGNVRLLDQKGQVHEAQAKDLLELKLQKQQSAEFNIDGTSSLFAEALWDSGAHNSTLLNRVTASSQRVMLTLSWNVEMQNCADPVPFAMDMAVTMMTRDARPPTNFLTFWGGPSKVLNKSSTVFGLRLIPPLTRTAKELWRLDTAEKYVRGEDVLGTWKPRGVSVVEDFRRLESQSRRSADVQAIKAILAVSPPVSTPQKRSKSRENDDDSLVQKSLDLWQKKLGHPGNVSGEKVEPTECVY